MNLATTQLKDTYGNLVTTGTTEGAPTSGGLQNGQGTLLTSVGIGTNTTSKELSIQGNTPTIEFIDAQDINDVAQFRTSAGNAIIDADVNNDKGSSYIAFTVDGTSNEKMRIDSSGNVGIGVSPSATLHIDNPANPTSLRIGNNTTDDCFIMFNTDGNDWAIGADRSASNSFKISDNSTLGTADRLIIDTSGNVGIGTDSPDKELDVQGNIRARNAGGASSAEIDITSGATWRLRSNPTSGTNSYGLDIIKGSAGTDVKMSIDTNGNVGIGVTPSTDAKVEISGGGVDIESTVTPRLRFYNSTTFQSGIEACQTVGAMIANSAIGDFAIRSQSNMLFATGGNTERMRIDSSGTLLVGKTASALATVGTSLFDDGTAYHTVDGNVTMRLNRLTDDGTIIDLRKDNTTVGSIGTADGQLFIANEAGSVDAGLLFGEAGTTARAIIPSRAEGTVVDNALDLGYASGRFKDLYLGGSVYLGGTTSANALDDYEEGTWTPVLRGSGTAGTYETTITSGKYTKVGNMVSINARITLAGSITGGGTGYAQITGVPFAKGADMSPHGSVRFVGVDINNAGLYANVSFITFSPSSTLYFPVIADNASSIDQQISGFSASDTLEFSITYFV